MELSHSEKWQLEGVASVGQQSHLVKISHSTYCDLVDKFVDYVSRKWSSQMNWKLKWNCVFIDHRYHRYNDPFPVIKFTIFVFLTFATICVFQWIRSTDPSDAFECRDFNDLLLRWRTVFVFPLHLTMNFISSKSSSLNGTCNLDRVNKTIVETVLQHHNGNIRFLALHG